MNGLLLLFGILNLADSWATWQVIRFGGHEAWLPKYLMNLTGTYWALVILKLGIVAFIWVLNVFDPLPVLFMALIDFGYAILVIWNYIQLQEAKRGKS